MPLSRRTYAVFAGLAAVTVGCAAARPAEGGPSRPLDQERPALVVLLVVDQLRGDMLEHYADALPGGFRRLREKGRTFAGASHNHAVTETAAGHATIATGVPPSRHGVVANTWREDVGGTMRSVYAVADSTTPILGMPGYRGRSPANLARTGLADWILAANPRARVVAASKKDRSAVTLAGQNPRAAVYWIPDGSGRFATSTYYEKAYPRWVERFNADVMSGLYADTVWQSVVPPELAHLSGPDSVPWEGDAVHTAFPHWASMEADTGVVGHNVWVDYSPIPDEAVLRFGLAALDALDLGRRGATDLLALSFSQTDYVGHDFGPFSREQLDNLVRLDRHLAALFAALDEKVGPGRWVAALTSDHGILTTPEQLQARGEPGYRVTRDDVVAILDTVREAIAEGGGDETMRVRIVERVEALPHVARVYRRERLAADAETDSVAGLFLRSTYEGRYPGLLSHLGFELVWAEGVLSSVRATGTNHLGPYWHDRWVPLAFLGTGVEAGKGRQGAFTWDVAPTLAALIGLPTPDDLQGRSLIP